MAQDTDKAYDDCPLAELRVVATVLADRAGLLGKGVGYANLAYGDREKLTAIIKRAKRRQAAAA